MQPADVLVAETITVLEQTSKHMRKLARLLRRSRVQLLRGEYDALCAFAAQAGKALEVGQDVGTRLEPLLKVLTPDEYRGARQSVQEHRLEETSTRGSN